MDSSPKTQAIERLREAQNVLITVSNDPSVDQLAAAIGLTLMLNKLNKHATAVFSGSIPSTLEFLKPEGTLEQNTDSLRDFIISLDKSKADKLRYKVEENVVKIFITPYRTSLSEADLEFSQGDFNVDAVVALGVDLQEHIDQAIMAHGSILHDATVIGIAAGQQNTELGSINWVDPTASSLCEMLMSISEAFQSGLLDNQMATAFLTGIVAETERFSNEKTSPKVMTISAQLMAAGANQQLIATQLTPSPPSPEEPAQYDFVPDVSPPPVVEHPPEVIEDLPVLSESPASDEGTVLLHDDEPPIPPPPIEPNTPKIEQIDIDKQGTLRNSEYTNTQIDDQLSAKKPRHKHNTTNDQNIAEPKQGEYSGYVTEPPQMGGTFTANTAKEAEESSTDPLSEIPAATFDQDNNAGIDSTDNAPEIPQPENVTNDEFVTASLPDIQSTNEVDDVLPDVNGESYGEQQTSWDTTQEKTMADIEAGINPGDQTAPQANTTIPADEEAARRAVLDAVNAASFDTSLPPLPVVPVESETPDSPLGEPTVDAPPIVPPPLIPPFPEPPKDDGSVLQQYKFDLEDKLPNLPLPPNESKSQEQKTDETMAPPLPPLP